MKINAKTKRHGRAVATALLHDIERLSTEEYGEHEVPRAIGHILGADPAAIAAQMGKTTEDGYRTASMKLFESYMQGLVHAPHNARAGFLEILADFFVDAVDGTVTCARAYEKPGYNGGKRGPAARERAAHAREWLKRGA